MSEAEPILATDGRDSWLLRPDDPQYAVVAAKEPDEHGVVHVDAGLLTAVRGWWWTEADQRVQQKLDELEIPWEELHVDDRAAREEEPTVLCERLAKLTYHITKVGREKARVESKLLLAKKALEHAANKRLADTDRAQGAVAVRTSIIISESRPLRDTQIEVWESDAYCKALDQLFELLELSWKLVSRIMSARMHEPVE